MEDNIKFQDAESYSGQSKDITFKQIVLQHLKEIGGYASKEMRGGYYEEQGSRSGFIAHTYIPDTREVYSHAVKYLADILYPHFDKEMLEVDKKLNDEFRKEWDRIWDIDSNKMSDDQKVQRARYYKLDNREKLFRCLCSFLHRIKYLDLGMMEE